MKKTITIQLWAAAAKSLQSCPTLCNPIDSSPPGSPIPGILKARTLEWVAISFSNAWKWKVKVKSLSRVQLLATPWTAAYQAPPFMGFSRQEYWSGVPLPSPIIVPNWYGPTLPWGFISKINNIFAYKDTHAYAQICQPWPLPATLNIPENFLTESRSFYVFSYIELTLI